METKTKDGVQTAAEAKKEMKANSKKKPDMKTLREKAREEAGLGKGKGKTKAVASTAETKKKDTAGVVGWQAQLAPLRKLTETMLNLREMPEKPAASLVAGLKAEIKKAKVALEAKKVTIPRRLAGRLAKALA